MPRTKNNKAAKRKRKKIFKRAKGNYGKRKNVYKVARPTVERALQYAYRDRKQKKRNFRKLWIQRINAAARQHGISYSQFMGQLKKKNIQLNRKVLADLAMNHPKDFEQIVNTVKQ
jgi:large subunit ribosomal protein L20